MRDKKNILVKNFVKIVLLCYKVLIIKGDFTV